MARYSDTISDALKDKVLRIHAQRVSDFKSCAFEIMEDMGDELTVCRWIRAQKDEESGYWVVREHETAPYLVDSPDIKASDISKMPTESRTLMHRACLIDALHACASFETLEREKGKQPAGPDIEELGTKHYKNAGEEEGIPFDIHSGLPVPMGNGIILTEKAALPSITEEFEERSKGNLLSKDSLPRISPSEFLGYDIDAPESFNRKTNLAKEHIATSTAGLQKLEKNDAKSKKHIQSLTKAFKSASRKGFRDIHVGGAPALIGTSALGAVSAGSVWGTKLASSIYLQGPLGLLGIASGFAGVFGAMVYFHWLQSEKEKPLEFPMRRFQKNLAKVRDDIEKIEDEQEKKTAIQAVNKMELYAYAYRASVSISDSKDPDVGKLYTKRMKRDLDKLEEKAKELGMPEADINNVLLTLKVVSEEDINLQFIRDKNKIENAFKNNKEQQFKRISSPTNG